jgi:hypothetical protein
MEFTVEFVFAAKEPGIAAQLESHSKDVHGMVNFLSVKDVPGLDHSLLNTLFKTKSGMSNDLKSHLRDLFRSADCEFSRIRVFLKQQLIGPVPGPDSRWKCSTFRSALIVTLNAECNFHFQERQKELIGGGTIGTSGCTPEMSNSGLCAGVVAVIQGMLMELVPRLVIEQTS